MEKRKSKKTDHWYCGFLLHKYLKGNFQIHDDTDIILVEKGNNQFISVTKSKQKYIDSEFMV